MLGVIKKLTPANLFMTCDCKAAFETAKDLNGPTVIVADPQKTGRGVDLTTSKNAMFVINVCTNDFAKRAEKDTSFGVKQLY